MQIFVKTAVTFVAAVLLVSGRKAAGEQYEIIIDFLLQLCIMKNESASMRSFIDY